jgi:monovalent cation:H+ antiporter-2, CPA2 family
METVSCSHLDAIAAVVPTSRRCEACVAVGDTWVELRMCLTCGLVGCCDAPPNRHASSHWRRSGHPVIRSVEPGEAWRWCYPDGEFV